MEAWRTSLSITSSSKGLHSIWSATLQLESSNRTREKIMEDASVLGIIFDIDGTLILEDHSSAGGGVHLRPGSIDFLKWCFERGHALALWTAASQDHLGHCLEIFCQAVQSDHECGPTCRKTFDFAWCHTKLRRATTPNLPLYSNHSSDWYYADGCRWCKWYSRNCARCQCHHYASFCPCTCTKDLTKVWKSKSPETKRFQKARTLIIENTPQQCVRNYGNAIYVPTYGIIEKEDEEKRLFDRLKTLILKLEEASDVRAFPKCRYNHGALRPHACFQQDWMIGFDDQEGDTNSDT